MSQTTGPDIHDGDPIDGDAIPEALTRSSFRYADGATQVFTRDGRTTFTENGTPTSGEWGVDENGRFWSFWPPSYRATYDVSWIVDADGRAAGVRFVDVRGGVPSKGRYALPAPN